MTMTTDPPPTSVIVTKSCTASVTVATPIAAGKYDTGMGKSGGVSWSPGGNNTAEGYQGYNTVAVHDKFSTWVMYMLPAVSSQGTIWVPLQSYSWDWSFTGQWLNSQWTETAASPATAADDPHYKPTGVMNIPPQWSLIQTNSK